MMSRMYLELIAFANAIADDPAVNSATKTAAADLVTAVQREVDDEREHAETLRAHADMMGQ